VAWRECRDAGVGIDCRTAPTGATKL
jgi:hypothetical protein